MTPLQEIELRQSERRQILNRLSHKPELSDDEFAELEATKTAYERGEVQFRAALESQDAADAQAANAPDRVELRNRARIGDYLNSVTQRVNLSGASAELNQELGLRSNEIPLELVSPVESRAVTPAPSTGTGVTPTMIEGYPFAVSVAPQLGIWMPTVDTGTLSVPRISTALTASAVSEGSAVTAGAGALTTATLTPKRVSARLEWTAESSAKSGMRDWEGAWRSHLNHALSARLDSYILRHQNTGQSPEQPQGLLGRFGTIDAETTTDGFDSSLGKFAGLIDGAWARSLSEIRLLTNAAVMTFMEATFRDLRETVQQGNSNVGGYGSNGDMSLATYLRMYSGGIMAHNRMPPPASNVSNVLAFRAGDGVTPRPHTAVCAVWPYIEIVDPFSSSASAVTNVTAHALVSDVELLQANAYSVISMKTA